MMEVEILGHVTWGKDILGRGDTKRKGKERPEWREEGRRRLEGTGVCVCVCVCVCNNVRTRGYCN